MNIYTSACIQGDIMTSTSIRIDDSTLNRLKNIKKGRSCDKTLNDLIDLHNERVQEQQEFSHSNKYDLTGELFDVTV